MPVSKADMIHRLKQSEKRMTLSSEGPVNPHTTDSHSTFSSLGLTVVFDREQFEKKLKVKFFPINKPDAEEVQFSVQGIDPPLANAFRRIMIAEVDCVAIEKVHLYQNLSVMHDEIFCHRLGLVPIYVPEFETRLSHPPEGYLLPANAIGCDGQDGEDDDGADVNTG
jgi:hypothetical protein